MYIASILACFLAYDANMYMHVNVHVRTLYLMHGEANLAFGYLLLASVCLHDDMHVQCTVSIH